MASVQTINDLLNDKLFQVIGSTPASIAESLKKIDLKNKKKEGAQLFAVSIFSSAVNKATLETFVADSRFSDVRPLITAALSISGRSNMTALTLLGHCFLATDLASEVTFANEFRKKMGQNHLWAGELEAGSLSDLQKKILKEKKRVTAEKEAKALGNGFLKHCGLVSGPLVGLENDYFGSGSSSSLTIGQSSTGTSQLPTSTVRSGENRRQAQGASQTSVSPPAEPTVPIDQTSHSPSTSRNQASHQRSRTQTSPSSDVVSFTAPDGQLYNIPSDVFNYRTNMLNQNDVAISDSIARNGFDGFVNNTRLLIERDPTGRGIQGAQSRVG